VATGFAASLGQILFLRELLVLFYGNELSTGLVFASWLLWTALGSACGGRFSQRLPHPVLVMAAALLVTALLLPATIVWIRATRLVWGIPPGEALPPGRMLLIALAATGPFCLAAGFLFAITWTMRFQAAGERAADPIHVYLGEACGAALGGLCFYFLFLPRLPLLAAAGAVAVCLAVTAGCVLIPGFHHGGRALRVAATVPWLAAGVASLALALHRPDMNRLSYHWLWGEQLLEVRDTPFHNLALLRQEDQFSLFATGHWLLSLPDPMTAERTAHPVLLEHPQPRHVLLVGGGASGLAREALKHPSVAAVECLEPDPGILRLLERHGLTSSGALAHDPRILWTHEDAASVIRRTDRSYDVILVAVGEPVSAQMNRFYTVEFYRHVTRLLAPGGILAVATGIPGELLGPVQADYLRSLETTLLSVFPQVAIFPAETVQMWAAGAGTPLNASPEVLAARLEERTLRADHVGREWLLDVFSPLRQDYLEAVLGQESAPEANHDFKPSGYRHALLVWGRQVHPALHQVLRELVALPPSRLWAGAAAAAAVLAVFGLRPRRGGRGVVLVAVTVVGGLLMVTEIVLLIAFQVVAGYLYEQLALIISCFMAGLALGGALPARAASVARRCRRSLIAVQVLLSGFLVSLTQLLAFLERVMEREVGTAMAPFMPWVFGALALMSGMIGGAHFVLAVQALAGDRAASGQVGGGLYGADLLGAAVAALGASLVLIPAYGLVATLGLSALLNLASALALLSLPPPAVPR
jgi:spermidine synthase